MPSVSRLSACVLSVLLALPSAAAVAADAALTPETVNNAETRTGSAGMLRAQILLDRARFSPGEIDGGGGSNTRRAIAGFQRSRNLKDTGELDGPTWDALNAGAGDVLITYTVTASDVAGPFRTLPTDMMEKSKLDALGYASAEEALGERFHASPKLLQRLNPGKTLGAGNEIVVPALDSATPIPKATKLIVDKSDSVVLLVDSDDKTLAQFPASTGSEHDPLPIGEWKVQGIAINPAFHYSPELFWDADPTHAKAKIAPGPNNPVGVVWIDLSKPHYGIHGTPEPSKVGKTESHGCIRLANWNATLVAQSAATGIPAILRE